MMTRTKISHLVVLTIVVLVALAIPASRAPNDQEAAARIAAGWASNGINQAAADLTGRLTKSVPLLGQMAAAVITNQIQSRLTWSYSTPMRIEDTPHQWQVVATVTAPLSINLPLIKRSYAISGNYVLRIDTRKQQVVEWYLDPTSVQIKETAQ
jgi:hypothetical protein